MKDSYDCIDFFKLVGSVFIFSMHFRFLTDYGYLGFFVNVAARWGVPFFFICSAFFLFRKGENGNIQKSELLQYIRRIMILYSSWFIINLPSIYIIFFSDKRLLSLNAWLFFFKNVIISSTYKGSWYLASCIFSALFVYYLANKMKTIYIIAIASPLYFLCIISSLFYCILPYYIQNAINLLNFPTNIFNGVFFFAIGKYIAENYIRLISYIKLKIILLIGIAAVILYLLETYICLSKGWLYHLDATFFIPIVSLSIFFFCLTFNHSFKHHTTFRNLSTIIYLSQGNLLRLKSYFEEQGFITNSILLWLLFASLTGVICMIILHFSKKYPILRKLY